MVPERPPLLLPQGTDTTDCPLAMAAELLLLALSPRAIASAIIFFRELFLLCLFLMSVSSKLKSYTVPFAGCPRQVFTA